MSHRMLLHVRERFPGRKCTLWAMYMEWGAMCMAVCEGVVVVPMIAHIVCIFVGVW